MDKTAIAVEVFNKYASEYQGKFMDTSLYHDSFDFFCESMPKPNAEVLELACGPGNVTHYLHLKRPDLVILGTDLAPRMLALAEENNPDAEFMIMDCRHLKSLGRTFDGIMGGFCLPYLSKEDAEQLIADASEILIKGGMLCLSTMEDEYSKSGFEKGSAGDEIYIHYHEADYLVKGLKDNNFSIEDLRRVSYEGNNGAQVTDLIIVAKKA